MRLGPGRHLPPVLLYHAVCPRTPATWTESRGLIVEPRHFERQMAHLAERGLRTVTLDEFAAAVTGRRELGPSVLLTFDDAYAHLAETVSPVLEAYGFTAAVFAAWETLGVSNTWDKGTALDGMRVAGREELAAMAAGPWEVGSHAHRHVDLRGLAAERLTALLARARVLLGDVIGRPVLDLAYPYGANDATVRGAARRAGYRLAFTVKHGDRGDPLRLPRQMVSGEDGALAFRLASAPRLSPWVGLLRDATPALARRSVRAVLR